jgi:hypothetical protein
LKEEDNKEARDEEEKWVNLLTTTLDGTNDDV